MLLFGNLNCAYDTGIKSPLDDAILQYGKVETSGYSKVGEIPFDFNRRRLSVIAQHADADCVYHSHYGQSPAQSPQSHAHDHGPPDRSHRHSAAVHAACRAARLYAATGALLPVSDRDDDYLSGAGRTRQAPFDEAIRR